MDIALRGQLVDNDSADILRWWGWNDLTAPADIAAGLEAAGGEDVTILINSPGGDMTVGGELYSILRRYPGKTTALFQGYGASAATMAAAGCTAIHSEPGALLCYHNPASQAEGDFHDMAGASEGLENARDCVANLYLTRKKCKPREEILALMDKNIWISPTQALEYGLIDAVEALAEEPEPSLGALVAAAGGGIRITQAMREKYQAHTAQLRETEARDTEAKRALSRIRALAIY